VTLRLAALHLHAILRMRDVRAVVAVAAVLVFVGNLWLGASFAPRGAVGTWLFDVDGSLTYGLGAALVAGGVGVAGVRQLAPQFHTAGIERFTLLAAWVAAVSVLGVLVRVIVSFVQLVAGAADSLLRSGHLILGSRVPLDADVRALGEVRTAALYAVAATLGAAVAAAVGNRLAATVILGLCVLPYLPAAQSVVDRGPWLLDALAVLPFGALRGALSGNGGLFGQSQTGVRIIDATLAAAVVAAYLLAALAAFALPRTGRGIGRPAVVAAAGIAAVLAGAVLPPVLSDTVPWRWRPQWRDAKAAGWASTQVAARWSQNLPLGHAATASVQPESALQDPFHVAVSFRLRRPLVSGNVEVRSGGYQLEFAYVRGRYVIRRVFGPFVAQARLVAR
jgi:hypothetical protein